MRIIPKKTEKVVVICIILFISNTIFPLSVLASEKMFINSSGMEFVLIPAGSFVMGSPPDEPHRDVSEVQHKVSISKPFYMQTAEVTLKQWRAVMGKKMFRRQKMPDNIPVIKVSWHDATNFIMKLNRLNEGAYRLPTEAEWEYACRAGTSTAYSWGNTIDCSRAMYSNNSLKNDECTNVVKQKGLKPDRPAPVKSYGSNNWGLFDMHGNVWEWCQDRYGNYNTNATTDPDGPDEGTFRVRRGGSWFKYGYSCRSANRAYAHPGSRLQTTGFRLVREVP